MLSPGHGGSLATTAGITSVITMVLAASLLGQCNGLTGHAQGLAAATLLLMVVGAGLLYQAREVIGQALDLGPSDPQVAHAASRRGLALYHFGKASLFVGLACGAAWRLALPFGELAWLAVLVSVAFALGAASNGARYLGVEGARVAQSSAPKQ